MHDSFIELYKLIVIDTTLKNKFAYRIGKAFLGCIPGCGSLIQELICGPTEIVELDYENHLAERFRRNVLNEMERLKDSNVQTTDKTLLQIDEIKAILNKILEFYSEDSTQQKAEKLRSIGSLSDKAVHIDTNQLSKELRINLIEFNDPSIKRSNNDDIKIDLLARGSINEGEFVDLFGSISSLFQNIDIEEEYRTKIQEHLSNLSKKEQGNGVRNIVVYFSNSKLIVKGYPWIKLKQQSRSPPKDMEAVEINNEKHFIYSFNGSKENDYHYSLSLKLSDVVTISIKQQGFELNISTKIKGASNVIK